MKKQIDFSEFLLNYKTSLTNKHVSLKLKVNQLKEIAKYLCLKTSITKPNLVLTINESLNKHYSAISIQKIIRTMLVKIWLKLHGPCFKITQKCNNITDFLTMESLEDIPSIQLFTFKDEQNFCYGFNISSFHQLFKLSSRSNPLKNPYNKEPIPRVVINSHIRLLKISKSIGIDLLEENTNGNDQINEIQYLNEAPEERVLRRTKAIFLEIDSLGNYTDFRWFMELNLAQLRIFLRELYDIWNYRANLSNQQKSEICPGDNLFYNINGRIFDVNENMPQFQNSILDIMNRLVTTGINTSSKTLGCYYILGALTIVNSNAANSLPWLYESFRL